MAERPLGYVVICQPHKPTRVYIPEAPYNASPLRTTIINEAHMELGHQGTRKTYLRITDSCYWPGMFKDVEKFVSMCKECQLNKQPTSKPAGVPHILPVPEGPWRSIAMDFVGPLTESQGFKNILVIMDRFSGFLGILWWLYYYLETFYWTYLIEVSTSFLIDYI
jgi:hypothetical protein